VVLFYVPVKARFARCIMPGLEVLSNFMQKVVNLLEQSKFLSRSNGHV